MDGALATNDQKTQATGGSGEVFQFIFDTSKSNYDDTEENGLCLQSKETGDGFCWFNIADGNAGTTYVLDKDKFTSLNTLWAGFTPTKKGDQYYSGMSSLATACDPIKDCFTCTGDALTTHQTCYRFQECNVDGDGECDQTFRVGDVVDVYFISGSATTEETALIKVELTLEGNDAATALTAGLVTLAATILFW